MTHRFKSATVSIAYVRTQTTLIGQARTVTADTLSGSVGFDLFRNLQLGLGSFVGRTSGGGGEAPEDRMVYGLSAAASYPLTTWIGARAAYRFALQDDGTSTIRHNIFTLSLDFSYPIRVD